MCIHNIHTLVLKDQIYIPLHFSFAQVCLPGLHITLGIFYRLFTLLEEACHKQDLRVVMEDSVDDGGVSYGRYVEAVRKLPQLKDTAER